MTMCAMDNEASGWYGLEQVNQMYLILNRRRSIVRQRISLAK